MHHLTLHSITDAVAYWTFFWNAIYCLAPPRETFNSPKYNKFLDLVSYYGSLNVRSLLMKVYQADPAAAPPTRPSDVPPTEQPPAVKP